MICTGLAGGRNGITPEMAAVNLKDARIPDNAGQKPVEEKIIREGPESLLSTLPVRKMKEELSGNGIPCDISYSAGTFVCNEVMYRLLFYMKESGREKKAGFIHVP